MTTPRRVLHSPVTALFLLAPLVAEFFLGDFPVYLLPLILPLSLWYGAGAVLVREVARRAGRGWPTMLLLGLAFGVVEEGLLTMSLFNPDYAGQHLLAHGYVAALGIGVPWTVFVLTIHVLWSIAAPIALVEETQGDRRTTPWLGDRGLAGVVGCLVLGAVVTVATSYPAYGHFIASTSQLVAAAVVAVALVGVALGLPHHVPTRSVTTSSAPGARVVLGVTLLAAGVFQVGGHTDSAWVSVPVMLVSSVVLAAVVATWSRSLGWGPQHRLAVASGLVLTYTWRAFCSGYGDTTAETVTAVVSYVAYALMALAGLRSCGRRVAQPATVSQVSQARLRAGADAG